MGKSINVLKLGHSILCHCDWFRFPYPIILSQSSHIYSKHVSSPWASSHRAKMLSGKQELINPWCFPLVILPVLVQADVRDNYEDSCVASLMNRHFVCIKVDEKRPDLDLFYMEASRMFNGQRFGPCTRFAFLMGLPFVRNLFPQGGQWARNRSRPQVLLV